MAGRENMVNSYDAGHQPYIHDPKRGKWEGRWDFFLSCVPNAFAIRSFLILGTYFQATGGGVGYVILILNILTAIYNSSMAAFPFLLLLKSFQRSATWMHCGNSWNTENCNEHDYNMFFQYTPNHVTNVSDTMEPQFEYYYREVLKLTEDSNVSWTAILGHLIVWVLVWCIIFRGIGTFGRFLRYSVLTCIIIVSVIFIRVCFLPYAWNDTIKLFSLSKARKYSYTYFSFEAATVTVFLLGRGWGTTMTMASFQPFKTNTEKYSIIIPIVLTGLSVVFGYIVMNIDGFISRRSEHSLYYNDFEGNQHIFAALCYFSGSLEAPQMWSVMVFFMFFLSGLNLIVIQLFSTVTALTDEYVHLREWRSQVAGVLCSICFILSVPFATKYFEELLKKLLVSSYFNKMAVCFLEVFIVVWVYGRERFLRDVRFMLGRNVSVWKFYIIRFVTPIFIAFFGFKRLRSAMFHIDYVPPALQLFVMLVKIIPWVGIPGYAIFRLVTSIGTILQRLRRHIKPNDWYPADPVDKQKYELALGASDISQQMLEMNDNNDATVLA